MGSSKRKSTTNSTTKPLDWQENDIKNIFNNANNLYDQQNSQGAPNYDTYQSLNGNQQNALSSMLQNSTGQNDAGNAIMQAGTGVVGSLGSGQSALNKASGNAASGAAGNFDHGTTSVSSLLSGLAGGHASTAQSALSSALGLAGTNATAQNAADAANYANSSGVQNAIKDTLAQSNDLYQRTTLPSLNAAAQAGGNLNSSRAGAAQAVSDGLQENRNAATASNMWNNAYQQGLSTAESARQSNLSGLLSSAGTALNGLNLSLAGQNAANDQTNANNSTALNWNSQLNSAGNGLVNAGQTGASVASAGQDIADQATKNALTAGTVQQTDAQSAADARLNNELQQKQFYWSLLNNLYGIEGANNWGQKSNSTTITKSTPSVGQMIQGGIGTLAGLGSSLMTGGLGGGSSLLSGLLGSSSKKSS